MTRTKLLALTFAVALAAGLAFCSATYGENPAPKSKLRIGTYKSYIIALAYYRSEVFQKQIADLSAQIEQAKADEKTELLKQLTAKSQALQQQVRGQLFGRAPVNNILANLKDALPGIAKASGVEIISGKVDYHSPDVELLDITDALVQQFNPSDETLEAIKSMGKHHSPVHTK